MTSLELDFNIHILLFLFAYLLSILTVVLLSRKLVKRKLSEPPKQFGEVPTILFVLFSIALLIFNMYLIVRYGKKSIKSTMIWQKIWELFLVVI